MGEPILLVTSVKGRPVVWKVFVKLIEIIILFEQECRAKEVPAAVLAVILPVLLVPFLGEETMLLLHLFFIMLDYLH